MSPIIGLNDKRSNLAKAQHQVYPQKSPEGIMEEYMMGLRQEISKLQDSITELQVSQKSSETINPYVLISTSECIEFVRCHNITRLEADGNYTYIYDRNGQKYTASKSIKYFADILPENAFLRSHQSHIVNINAIKKYCREDGGQIILDNDKAIPVSRNKRNEMMSVFRAMSV